MPIFGIIYFYLFSFPSNFILKRYKDIIVKIDIKTGAVVRTFNFQDLFPMSKRMRGTDCFNGIAYNETDNSFMVTGKLWSKMYRVSVQL